ncbi:MAG: Fe-Mn family superoxide dismutase [Puniceicoccales bacterium]|nr:Fe-Mn family superoxide dismutase [Puniceicoccales bacterium]
MGHLGSSWTWLAVDENMSSFICSTLNHDNPLMKKYAPRIGQPLFGVRSMETCLLLKYNNCKGLPKLFGTSSISIKFPNSTAQQQKNPKRIKYF